jgi:uncharacterized protein (TIGR02118 family)
MAKVYAMYKHPADAAAFDRYYYSVHVPLAKTIPGLDGYEVTRGAIANVAGGPTPYHLIATLSFSSLESINAALASPQGVATAADLGNFATAGVDLFVAHTESI